MNYGNQDINEESINNQEENNVQNDATSQDNVTAAPSAEELLAEEKDRYIRLYAEFENYKKERAKRRWNSSSMPTRR
ncbi:heat shock protein GrpE [Chryseobacterium gleum]|uniref:Heat shock protein GrpE n=1 Tax=Chryseobacterium gleum TaxID=250 RepID=A0A448BC28_CHRGE|nr:heat shock protein GrpE [Chryseobacterium gleum]